MAFIIITFLVYGLFHFCFISIFFPSFFPLYIFFSLVGHIILIHAEIHTYHTIIKESLIKFSIFMLTYIHAYIHAYMHAYNYRGARNTL